ACPDGYGPVWASLDGLLSYVYGVRVFPPLATTSPPGTPRAQAGIFNQPTQTTSLFAGRINADERSGFRLRGGGWVDAQRQYGIEGGFMHVESQSELFGASNKGDQILARPYTNAITNAPEAVLITFPGSSSGGLTIRASSGCFYEAHLDLVENLWNEGMCRI